MLAENLVDMPHQKQAYPYSAVEQRRNQDREGIETGIGGSLEHPASNKEDDEHTMEEDDALITKEERLEELEALQNEMDLPLEELLKRYNTGTESCPSTGGEIDKGRSDITNHYAAERNGNISVLDNHVQEAENVLADSDLKDTGKSDKQPVLSDSSDEQDDGDYVLAVGDDKDDEATLIEEEELARKEDADPVDEGRNSDGDVENDEGFTSGEDADNEEGFNSDEVAEEEQDYASTSTEDSVDFSLPQNDKPQGKDTAVSKSAFEQNNHGETKKVVCHDGTEEVEPCEEEKENDDIIADAAAAARSAQPTGNTFSTTKVRTKFPFLLKHSLREYQHIGLDWLVTMYEKRLNGILADEMGLGKTIMTIALLAHLACEKGIWGPHLIVVPTSVMLNWETEFLKWCPAFKILTYFGSAKERKFKRQGWMKPNSFHACITTYRLVIQDSKAFKRKKWKYLILDEAHLIKNWKSQRWQTLLNFNSKRRILLTGTPLQNDLMELWSLMHFLMPHIFQSHQEFKDWFSNPISGMVDGQEKVNKEVVDRLHNVLRPFILRRLKRDVEKQLPSKHEHVIVCRLSKRQRNLYEDFIASSETQATLASANFFGMISVIMQLRKVCNHPDLFEGRPIVSSFDMDGIDMQLSSSVCTIFSPEPLSAVDLMGLGLLFTQLDFSLTSWEIDEVKAIMTPATLIEDRVGSENLHTFSSLSNLDDQRKRTYGVDIFEEVQKALREERVKEAKNRAASIAWWNSLHCQKKPMYGVNLRERVTLKHSVSDIHFQKNNPSCYLNFSSKLADIVLSPLERFTMVSELVESFMFAIPAARVPLPSCWCSKTGAPVFIHRDYEKKCVENIAPLLSPIRPAIVRRQVYFPDRRLIQFDCGKLQKLAVLLRRLKSEGHRALIFTQMTKMLDILEAFINLYGYTYMRLDGSTQPEERQTLMQRFNSNPKIFLFILSTRSGGVGINLVGADTVIFYDSDWNPAMDQQAQDRCHRIGQTREVHIYRLISECTIEENILKKAHQKRALDDLVIQSGGYNTEFFKKLNPMELFSDHQALSMKSMQRETASNNEMEVVLSNADVEAALQHAEDEADYMALKKVEQEEAVDNQEFADEGIGRMEDDDFGNEGDVKLDEKLPSNHNWITVADKDDGSNLNLHEQNEETVLALGSGEEDVDMLADVRQMAAAAAAAGQASSSFENQLRPIDRYAMRFLDLWDPIINKSAMDSQLSFEETEWELDRIEKLKEDMEAEIDEDEEPLVYESWDADFATEAYRQEVEALAQRQLMEELEIKAKEAEDAANCESARYEVSEYKPKSKKKTKKAKFKSLKKEALVSELENTHAGMLLESISTDDEISDSEGCVLSNRARSYPSVYKKRKKASEMEEEKTKKSSKKLKKTLAKSMHAAEDCCILDKNLDEARGPRGEIDDIDLEHKPVSRSKMGGKISVTSMPVKRVLVVRPEKFKKKGNIWARSGNPSPDTWSSQEDAILCAVVHEYGTHWNLVSDTLYGMTAGGSFRGRFRHPVHCCERFRELYQKYILCATENPNIEKAGSTGSGKAIFKVTEENVRTLLDVTSEVPDNERLLQKHFTGVLSSMWRARSHLNHWQILPSTPNGFYSGGRFSIPNPSQNFKKSMREPLRKMNFVVSRQNSKLVALALLDADRSQQVDSGFLCSIGEETSVSEETVDIAIEFQKGEDDSEFSLLNKINLSIYGSEQLPAAVASPGRELSDCLRLGSKNYINCLDGHLPDFTGHEIPRSRSASKQQSLGKNKVPPSDLAKSSKSKLLKAATEPSEDHHFTETLSLPSCATSTNSDTFVVDLDSQTLINFLNEDGIDVIGGNSNFSLDGMFNSDLESFEGSPHIYDPAFIEGLQDYKSLQEDTDVG
ncbi:hypothetical protein Sjap_021554 [Stephania japonica]|uniref:DNA helicase n=1 Tax=Stephania japonica TaxID=461633 RepID=A0AAP0HSY6_9MAGN